MVSKIDNQPQAQNAVMYWLREDAIIRSRDYLDVVRADAPLRQKRIYNRELPLAWAPFARSWSTISEAGARGRVQPDQKLLRAGHLCLNACSLARSAYVWGEISAGSSVRQANEDAFGLVSDYFSELSEGKPTPLLSSLRMPIAEAVNSNIGSTKKEYGDPESTLTVTAGLAVTALIKISDYRAQRGRILCPPLGPVPQDYNSI